MHEQRRPRAQPAPATPRNPKKKKKTSTTLRHNGRVEQAIIDMTGCTHHSRGAEHAQETGHTRYAWNVNACFPRLLPVIHYPFVHNARARAPARLQSRLLQHKQAKPTAQKKKKGKRKEKTCGPEKCRSQPEKDGSAAATPKSTRHIPSRRNRMYIREDEGRTTSPFSEPKTPRIDTHTRARAQWLLS